MDWKYLHFRTDVTRTRGLWYLIAKAAEKPGRGSVRCSRVLGHRL